MKLQNISGMVIGVLLVDAGKIKQVNVKPFEYIIVESLNDQVYNLLDPDAKQLMEIMEV